MLTKPPEEIYRDYERFLRKKDYRRAYQRLETLLRELPDDEILLQKIISVCLSAMQDLAKARSWLKRLIAQRDWWYDHLLLSRVLIGLDDIPKAKESLKQARHLLKRTPFAAKERRAAAEDCAAVDELIKDAQENAEFMMPRLSSPRPVRDKKIRTISLPQPPPEVLLAQKPAKNFFKQPTVDPMSKSPMAPEILPRQESPAVPFVPLHIEFLPLIDAVLLPFQKMSPLSLKEARMRLDFEHLVLQGEFKELLCLNHITGIEKYWYQIETVKKVLKYFHGRALLCDEVGLGKTVEAGMLIKEYLMRHMAKNILILVPPSLVSQWQEEMVVKFGLSFTTTEDPLFSRDPVQFWKTPFLIASIHTAKHEKNLALITGQFFDIVVVDEAHHLRNRSTQAWHLVNTIQKKFIFLLTATPVQNNLIELYNLITLLKPGQLKTEKMFKKEFMTKGDARMPVNKEKLRDLLKEVMIRNTRSAIDLKLPRRFAVTMRLTPTEMERKVYERLNAYLRVYPLKKSAMNLLLKEAGSSPFALRETFLKMIPESEINETIAAIHTDDDIAKGKALIDILTRNPGSKKIVFTQYFKSMDYITDCLKKHGMAHTTFRGDMTAAEKDQAIQQFKDEVDIIVSTESGGEGRNLQFCNTIINFDLPWNPMRIEQRIGRLHRIGQTKDVFVFNFSVQGTIEDYIIDILDNKINMFEMVIGEIEPILGHIGQDQDFEDIIMGIWLDSKDHHDLGKKMEQLGNDLVQAKQEYIAAKSLDEEILGDDYQT